MIEQTAALVLKHSLFAQNRETVCKSLRHIELQLVLNGQFYCYIHNGTNHNSYKFCLRMRSILKKKTSHNSIAALALIVLHKIRGARNQTVKSLFIVTLKKVAS